jgi:hypothetical protein
MTVIGGIVLCALARVAGAQGGAAAQPAAAPPAAAAPAPAPTAPAAEHKVVAPNDIKWGDVPPIFNKGAKMAVLLGDPSKDGMFIVRLKMPAGYKVMPHWHPTDENVTILSGGMAIGMGDKLDPKIKPMPVGTFFSMPAKMHHFAVAAKESVVEVSGMGPFSLTYINPADDPSKAAAPPAK